MRNSGIEAALPSTYQNTPPRKKTRKALILYAILLWVVLVTAGIAGAKMYSDRIQQEVSADLQRQTASQITVMQQEFDSRLTKLEANYTDQLTQMQSKIQALNELLTFTKDNADSKTDNSNKLYSQLAEVQKQLNELKKSLDVLK
ncbi:hypothetical protein [Cohnella sp.]|uniref:hypothetical protein n=1 Tax=Cohnella sp. TaxID=1883426 RepID=UPI00356315FC